MQLGSNVSAAKPCHRVAQGVDLLTALSKSEMLSRRARDVYAKYCRDQALERNLKKRYGALFWLLEIRMSPALGHAGKPRK